LRRLSASIPSSLSRATARSVSTSRLNRHSMILQSSDFRLRGQWAAHTRRG
jgi:hypothetical protein